MATKKLSIGEVSRSLNPIRQVPGAELFKKAKDNLANKTKKFGSAVTNAFNPTRFKSQVENEIKDDSIQVKPNSAFTGKLEGNVSYGGFNEESNTQFEVKKHQASTSLMKKLHVDQAARIAKQHRETLGEVKKSSNLLAQIHSFQTEIQTNYYTNSLKNQDTMIEVLRGIKSALYVGFNINPKTGVQDQEDEGEKSSTIMDKLFFKDGFKGFLSGIGDIFTNTKNQAISNITRNIPGMEMLSFGKTALSMLSSEGAMKMMIGIGIKQGIKYLLENGLNNYDIKGKDHILNMFLDPNEGARRFFSANKGNSISDFFASVLGIDMSKAGIEKGMSYRGTDKEIAKEERMNFDGRAYLSLTKVIPDLLGRIHAAVSGNTANPVFYDYDSASYISMQDADKKARDHGMSSAFKNAINSIKQEYSGYEVNSDGTYKKGSFKYTNTLFYRLLSLAENPENESYNQLKKILDDEQSHVTINTVLIGIFRHEQLQIANNATSEEELRNPLAQLMFNLRESSTFDINLTKRIRDVMAEEAINPAAFKSIFIYLRELFTLLSTLKDNFMDGDALASEFYAFGELNKEVIDAQNQLNNRRVSMAFVQTDHNTYAKWMNNRSGFGGGLGSGGLGTEEPLKGDNIGNMGVGAGRDSASYQEPYIEFLNNFFKKNSQKKITVRMLNANGELTTSSGVAKLSVKGGTVNIYSDGSSVPLSLSLTNIEDVKSLKKMLQYGEDPVYVEAYEKYQNKARSYNIETMSYDTNDTITAADTEYSNKVFNEILGDYAYKRNLKKLHSSLPEIIKHRDAIKALEENTEMNEALKVVRIQVHKRALQLLTAGMDENDLEEILDKLEKDDESFEYSRSAILKKLEQDKEFYQNEADYYESSNGDVNKYKGAASIQEMMSDLRTKGVKQAIIDTLQRGGIAGQSSRKKLELAAELASNGLGIAAGDGLFTTATKMFLKTKILQNTMQFDDFLAAYDMNNHDGKTEEEIKAEQDKADREIMHVLAGHNMASGAGAAVGKYMKKNLRFGGVLGFLSNVAISTLTPTLMSGLSKTLAKGASWLQKKIFGDKGIDITDDDIDARKDEKIRSKKTIRVWDAAKGEYVEKDNPDYVEPEPEESDESVSGQASDGMSIDGNTPGVYGSGSLFSKLAGKTCSSEAFAAAINYITTRGTSNDLGNKPFAPESFYTVQARFTGDKGATPEFFKEVMEKYFPHGRVVDYNSKVRGAAGAFSATKDLMNNPNSMALILLIDTDIKQKGHTVKHFITVVYDGTSYKVYDPKRPNNGFYKYEMSRVIAQSKKAIGIFHPAIEANANRGLGGAIRDILDVEPGELKDPESKNTDDEYAGSASKSKRAKKQSAMQKGYNLLKNTLSNFLDDDTVEKMIGKNPNNLKKKPSIFGAFQFAVHDPELYKNILRAMMSVGNEEDKLKAKEALSFLNKTNAEDNKKKDNRFGSKKDGVEESLKEAEEILTGEKVANGADKDGPGIFTRLANLGKDVAKLGVSIVTGAAALGAVAWAGSKVGKGAAMVAPSVYEEESDGYAKERFVKNAIVGGSRLAITGQFPTAAFSKHLPKVLTSIKQLFPKLTEKAAAEGGEKVAQGFVSKVAQWMSEGALAKWITSALENGVKKAAESGIGKAASSFMQKAAGFFSTFGGPYVTAIIIGGALLWGMWSGWRYTYKRFNLGSNKEATWAQCFASAIARGVTYAIPTIPIGGPWLSMFLGGAMSVFMAYFEDELCRGIHNIINGFLGEGFGEPIAGTFNAETGKRDLAWSAHDHYKQQAAERKKNNALQSDADYNNDKTQSSVTNTVQDLQSSLGGNGSPYGLGGRGPSGEESMPLFVSQKNFAHISLGGVNATFNGCALATGKMIVEYYEKDIDDAKLIEIAEKNLLKDKSVSTDFYASLRGAKVSPTRWLDKLNNYDKAMVLLLININGNNHYITIYKTPDSYYIGDPMNDEWKETTANYLARLAVRHARFFDYSKGVVSNPSKDLLGGAGWLGNVWNSIKSGVNSLLGRNTGSGETGADIQMDHIQQRPVYDGIPGGRATNIFNAGLAVINELNERRFGRGGRSRRSAGSDKSPISNTSNDQLSGVGISVEYGGVPPWVTIAKAEMTKGIRVPRDEHAITDKDPGGIEVLTYIGVAKNNNINASPVNAKDAPNWCAAFVSYCFIKAGVDIGKMNGLSSQSYANTEYVTKLEKPTPGCLIVWNHLDENGDKTDTGHVAMVSDVFDDGITYIGGNQMVDKEIRGITEKSVKDTRLGKNYEFLGYFWLKSAPMTSMGSGTGQSGSVQLTNPYARGALSNSQKSSEMISYVMENLEGFDVFDEKMVRNGEAVKSLYGIRNDNTSKSAKEMWKLYNDTVAAGKDPHTIKDQIKKLAQQTYLEQYWNPVGLDGISDYDLQLILFNSQVNGWDLGFHKKVFKEAGYDISASSKKGFVEQLAKLSNGADADTRKKIAQTALSAQHKYYNYLADSNASKASFKNGWNNRVARISNDLGLQYAGAGHEKLVNRLRKYREMLASRIPENIICGPFALGAMMIAKSMTNEENAVEIFRDLLGQNIIESDKGVSNKLLLHIGFDLLDVQAVGLAQLMSGQLSYLNSNSKAIFMIHCNKGDGQDHWIGAQYVGGKPTFYDSSSNSLVTNVPDNSISVNSVYIADASIALSILLNIYKNMNIKEENISEDQALLNSAIRMSQGNSGLPGNSLGKANSSMPFANTSTFLANTMGGVINSMSKGSETVEVLEKILEQISGQTETIVGLHNKGENGVNETVKYLASIAGSSSNNTALLKDLLNKDTSVILKDNAASEARKTNKTKNSLLPMYDQLAEAKKNWLNDPVGVKANL